MVKKMLGVVIGYAIFVASSIALFQVSGQNPHGEVTAGFLVFTAIYGSIFSLVAGFVLELIARTGSLRLNYVLAFIIAGFAAFSLSKATGTHWSQIMAITLFAPTSIAGGVIAIRRDVK